MSSVVHRLSSNEPVLFSPWQVLGMLRSGVSEIPRLLANEPSSLLPIGRECPIFYGVGSMPCAMFGQLKHRLIRLNVYSIKSEDRLGTFAVTRFLYRTIGDGRNTGVLRVLILTMSSELYKKIHNNSDTYHDLINVLLNC